MAKPRYEWDAGKNRANQAKHGVAFELALRAFSDPCRVILEDLKHSAQERRFYCLGYVDGGILTVRFTWRAEVIRIIGAGYWRQGKELYEKENQIHG